MCIIGFQQMFINLTLEGSMHVSICAFVVVMVRINGSTVPPGALENGKYEE